jgi:hypothetical protein
MTFKLLSLAAGVVALAGAAQAQMFIDSGTKSGTHGEPLEDVAILQGCIFEQAVPSCELTSNGFRYYVSWDDPPCMIIETVTADKMIMQLAGGDGTLYKYVRP